MSSLKFIIDLLLVAHLAEADPLVFSNGRSAPELDALFQQKDDWIGGDGAYSLSLTPERTLWLFCDTWVGSIRDGKRTNAHLVNNTLALQDVQKPASPPQFIISHNANGKPTAFLTPQDKHGWFWFHSGICTSNQLYLFMMQLEKTDTNNVFGFHQIGEWLGVVTNPLDPPATWQVEQHKLPCAQFRSDSQITFGAAMLADGGYLYIYGTVEHIQINGNRSRQLVVARVSTNDVADFSAWRFYADGQWVRDYRKTTPLADDLAPEYSVTYLPKFGQYALVYTELGFSPKIQVRTASTPWGKWSAPVTVYQCPEMGRDKNIFCYGAKAHPSLAADDELIITYEANSFDFWQVVNDASLYWPRFVRVKLTTGKN